MKQLHRPLALAWATLALPRLAAAQTASAGSRLGRLPGAAPKGNIIDQPFEAMMAAIRSIRPKMGGS